MSDGLRDPSMSGTDVGQVGGPSSVPRHRVWLNVGRVAVALVAVLVLAATGLE